MSRSISGIGLGLRSVHYDVILEHRPDVPWFEIISENYMGPQGGSGGRPLEKLEQIHQNYPVVMHGVSLNIGSVDALNLEYLKQLKALADRLGAETVSDHLCWTGVSGQNLHDLLPLPYTHEALNHITDRVQRIQDIVKRPLVLENVSTYLAYTHSQMTEWEFISRLVEQTHCGVLLDVNNVYVSSRNLNFDPIDFLKGIPSRAVKQMHLAGYSESGNILIDTHDHPVTDPVWALYEKALDHFGDIPTLIEWDDKIPELNVLQIETAKAEAIRKKVFKKEKVLV